MAVKRKGLGKGLDSLIPENKSVKPAVKPEKAEESVKNGEQMLKINQVEPNREQPRKHFEEDALLELADSIKQYGVLQPLLVRKRKDYYEIIAGERRWRAAKLAGLKEVPVVIRDMSEQEIMEISLIENIQRENLNPIEEAAAYKKLLEEFGLKQEEVADRVSKSRTAVTNSMRLLKLAEQVQTMLINEELSMGHARALLAIEKEEVQVETAKAIVERKLSVRETEKLVKAILNPKQAKLPIPSTNDVVYEKLSDKLKEIMGTKVNINHKKGGKGKIEIEYYSQDELERLLELFDSIQNQ